MSGIEQEVRESLDARASALPVGRADEAGLGRRLVAARRRRRTRLGSAGLAVLVAVGGLAVVARMDEDGSNVIAGPDPSSATTTLPPSPSSTELLPDTPTTLPGATSVVPLPPRSATSTTAHRTTSTTAPLGPLPAEAVWPEPGTTTRFATPAEAAGDFARRFLGMGTPQLGAPRLSGADATVAVRPLPTSSLVSVISLRRTDSQGWVVTGCAAPSIIVDQPAAGATISSPLTVRGRARAFEGTVNVEVRRDGATAPIGDSFGTGGGTEILAFEATVTFPRPAAARGTVVVSEARADESTQGPAAATVVRIAF